MGVKSAIIVSLLAVASIGIQVGTLFMPTHSIVYSTGLGLARVFTLTTYFVKGRKTTSPWLCNIMTRISPGFCDDSEADQSLQEVAMRFCTSGARSVFPGACEAIKSCSVCGLAVVVAMGLNICLLLVAVYLIYDYTTRSKKQQYRQIAQTLTAAGTFILSVALVSYGIFAVRDLNDLQSPGGVANFAIAPGGGPAVGTGYMVVWVSVLVQMVIVALSQAVASGDEMNEEERMLMKAAKDQEAQRAAMEAGSFHGSFHGSFQQPPTGYEYGYGAAAPPSYGYGPAPPPMGNFDAGMSPPPLGFGMDPAMAAPPMGFNQPAPQPAGGMQAW